jgi:L-lysine 2,3-aminomutase
MATVRDIRYIPGVSVDVMVYQSDIAATSMTHLYETIVLLNAVKICVSGSFLILMTYVF